MKHCPILFRIGEIGITSAEPAEEAIVELASSDLSDRAGRVADYPVEAVSVILVVIEVIGFDCGRRVVLLITPVSWELG